VGPSKEFRAAVPPGPPPRGNWTALISLGISKLVRFHKSASTAPGPYFHTLIGRRRRAAFRRAASNARMARLRRDSATRSYQSSLASRALMSDRMWSSNGITHHQPWCPGATGWGARGHQPEASPNTNVRRTKVGGGTPLNRGRV